MPLLTLWSRVGWGVSKYAP